MDYLTHILALNLKPADVPPEAVVAPRLPGRFEPAPLEGVLGGSAGFDGWMPGEMDGESDTEGQPSRPAMPRQQPAPRQPAGEEAPDLPARPVHDTPARLDAGPQAPLLEPVRPARPPRLPEAVLSPDLPAAPTTPRSMSALPIPAVPFAQLAGQAHLTQPLAPATLPIARPAAVERVSSLSPAPSPARHLPKPATAPADGQPSRPATSQLQPAPVEPHLTVSAVSPPAPPSETVIHVNIGRIEVKASPTQGEKPARARQPAVVMTLEEYLQRRRGKGDER